MAGERGTLRALSAVAMAILPIGAIFAAYLLVYVSGKSQYLTQRNFRTLGTMSRQLSERLVHIRQTADDCRAAGLDACLEHRLGLNLERREPASPEGAIPCDTFDSSARVEWRAMPDTRVYDLTVGYELAPWHTTPLRVNFKRIIEAQLAAGIFDDIIVSDAAGHIFYQHREFETGALPDLQTLLRPDASTDLPPGDRGRDAETPAVKPGDSARSALDVPFSRSKEVGYLGQKYLAFFQSVPVGSMSLDGAAGVDRLLLCGLVKAGDFEASTREISPMLLSALSLLLLLAVFAWQLLKLWYLGRRERVDGLDVHLLVLSSIAVTSLITAAALDLLAYRGMTERRDREMRVLANRIGGNFVAEIRDVYGQLQRLRAAIEPEASRLAGATHDEPDRAVIDNVGKRITLEGTYPYFADLVWISPAGAIRARWGPRFAADGTLQGLKDPESPPFLVADRRYFADVQASRLWQVRADGSGETMRFAIEVVQSKLTGRDTIVLAAPVRETEPRSEMVAVGSRFLSTIDSTLPPGFEFAIVNLDGRVQLHSDEGRDLQENLFQECDDSRTLRTAVESRRSIHLDAPYYGEDHRLYTLPLADTPWSLVVLRRNDLLYGTNAWIGLVWLVGFVSYVVSILLAGVAVRWLRPSYRAEWLWPDRRQGAVYAVAGIVLAAAAVLCFLAALHGDAGSELVSILSAPLVGIGTLHLLLLDRGRSSEAVRVGVALATAAGLAMLVRAGSILEALALAIVIALGSLAAARLRGRAFGREGVFRSAYAAMLSSLLVLIAVGPAFVLFRSAFEQAMVAATRVGQRQMLDALVSRASRVREQASGQGIDPPWKKRLAEDRDVYCADLCETSGAALSGDGGWGELQDSYLAGSLARRIPAPNRAVERIRQAVAGEASDEAWRWKRSGRRRIELEVDNPSLRPALGDRFSLSTSVPAFLPLRGVDRWLAVMLTLLWPCLMFGAVYFIARKLFLLDADRTDRIGPLPGQNRWVFVNTARDAPKSLQIHTVDLRALNAPSECERLPDEYRVRSSGTIILDHFETRLDRPEWNTAKLRLLELLAGRDDTAVVVMSDVDPLAYWSESAASGAEADGKAAPGCMAASDLARWAEVLATFDEFCVARDEAADHRVTELLGSEATGLFAVQGGLDHTARCTSAEYRAVWSLCTKTEKLVLVHLADEGYANPKNVDVVGHLMRRGLIVRDRALEIRPQELAAFVKDVETADTIVAWEGELGRSGWAKLKPVLLGAVTLGVGFFYITQRGLFDSTIATAGAVAGALPILLRLLGTLGQDRGAGQQRS